MQRLNLIHPLALALTLCLFAPPAAARTINDAALADDSDTSGWLAYGRTYSEQRFSPLEQINTRNVADLRVAWYVDLPDAVGLPATPLVADGVMYFTDSRNVVHAVDATSGASLWQYTPAPDRDRSRVSFVHGSRGVGLWEDKVFVATVAGRPP